MSNKYVSGYARDLQFHFGMKYQTAYNLIEKRMTEDPSKKLNDIVEEIMREQIGDEDPCSCPELEVSK